MIVGLDYGTTTSLAISWKADGLFEESRLLSAVFVDKDKCCETNENAYRNKTSLDGSYVHSPKTMLASKDACQECYDKLGVSPDDLICATLKDMFSKLAVKLKSDEKVRMTLTVPNAWRDRQYVAMRNCVFRAAQEVFGPYFDKEHFTIIPEPVAAALHYILNENIYGDSDLSYVVVCDVGGGTSDLAVVKCEKYQANDGFDLIFDVVCPMEGVPGLGGDDFDRKLFENLMPGGIPEGIPEYSVWKSIKILKSRLSTTLQATIPIVKKDNSPILDRNNRPVCISCSRAQFEKMISVHLERLTSLLRNLKCALAEYDPACDFSKVRLLPVGGSCRIPAVRAILGKVFEGAVMIDMENERRETYDSIASGAAYYSAWMNGGIHGYNSIDISNRLPHRISILYAESSLETWVEKNSPDGVYCPKTLYPVRMDDNGDTFSIGKISLYQGDGNFVNHDENELLLELEIPDVVHSHGRSLDEIPVSLEIEIKNSRVNRMSITIKDGLMDKEDYIYEKIL